jgi:tRNA-dihydrouridine synthase B
VTLKMRTGFDREHVNGLRIAAIAEDAGVVAVAVHGRTREMHYRGEAEYETIAAIKRAVGIPVLANGDIDSAAKARTVLEATGADGLMIGRAAQGRPWLFREIARFLQTGLLSPPPGPAQVGSIAMEHVSLLHAFYGEAAGVRIARKHLGWYVRDLPDGRTFRASVNRVESGREQLALTAEYFARLEEPRSGARRAAA